jgi:predicted transcriptional regulator
MTKEALVSGLVDDSVAAAVERLAARLERKPGSIVAEAVETFVAEQNAFHDSLDEADRQIDRGEFSTQAEVEAWLHARRGRAAAE